MADAELTSEGFDLDALPQSSAKDREQLDSDSDSNGDRVVYEVGGTASIQTSNGKETSSALGSDRTERHATDRPDDASANNEQPAPMDSEAYKKQGNSFFQHHQYERAIQAYTRAIQESSLTVDEEAMTHWDHELTEDDTTNHARAPNVASPATSNETATTPASDRRERVPEPVRQKIDAIKSSIGTKTANDTAVYFCNRAAASFQLERWDDCIADSTVALRLNPKYTKAFVRRSSAYERKEQTDMALKDAKAALQIDPRNSEVLSRVRRLQAHEDERLERLKEETLGKLKELGNSILGNFGLSVDNFQAVKDPSTGSYNIKFQQ